MYQKNGKVAQNGLQTPGLSFAFHALTVHSLVEHRILRQILNEEGFAGWGVFKDRGSPNDGRVSIWRLFHFKMRREAKVFIPIAWLYDRRRDTAIRDLVALAIDNCSYPVARADRNLPQRSKAKFSRHEMKASSG